MAGSITTGKSMLSEDMRRIIKVASAQPATAPSGSASSNSAPSSPSSSTETSARVMPSTRRLASSQARSESVMRAAL